MNIIEHLSDISLHYFALVRRSSAKFDLTLSQSLVLLYVPFDGITISDLSQKLGVPYWDMVLFGYFNFSSMGQPPSVSNDFLRRSRKSDSKSGDFEPRRMSKKRLCLPSAFD